MDAIFIFLAVYTVLGCIVLGVTIALAEQDIPGNWVVVMLVCGFAPFIGLAAIGYSIVRAFKN